MAIARTVKVGIAVAEGTVEVETGVATDFMVTVSKGKDQSAITVGISGQELTTLHSEIGEALLGIKKRNRNGSPVPAPATETKAKRGRRQGSTNRDKKTNAQESEQVQESTQTN